MLPWEVTQVLAPERESPVALNMVIAQDTEYVLLDEPTNDLDIYHAANLHEINSPAFYSDYICALQDGRVAKFGTVEEVMTKETLSELYQVDFKIMTIAGRPLSIYY